MKQSSLLGPTALLSLISIFLFSILSSGCHKKSGVGDAGLEELRTAAMTHAVRQDFDKSDSIGRQLYDEAVRKGNAVYMAYGLLSQSYLSYNAGEENKKRKKRAEEALAKALETGNDTLISRVYNVLGTFATLYDYDFAMAIHYYSEAKKYADAAGARDFAMGAECNISELYHSVGDTLGLPYDMDIYEFAKSTSNTGLMLPSAQHLAEHLLRSPSTAPQALKYIRAIDSVDYKYLYHRLMGDYHQVRKEYPQALSHYAAALTDEKGSPGIFMSYARLYNTRGEYARSNEMLCTAEKRLESGSHFNPYRIELFRLYADNYHHLGETGQAYTYLESYNLLRDSLQTIRNQEQTNRFRIKYEVGKKELEITRSRSRLRILTVSILSVTVIAALIIIFIVVYYRRRNHLISVIVDRQRELLRISNITNNATDDSSTETDVTLSSDMMPAEDKNTSGNRVFNPGDSATETFTSDSGISEAKSNEIWSRIQREMTENQIYRDASVSRDIFASRVGCNHTWFSQIIKERTGKTYPQFINARRIEEALRILSDPHSDLTHEELWRSLGFTTKATFYSTFKSIMAMSPAEYRRQALLKA